MSESEATPEVPQQEEPTKWTGILSFLNPGVSTKMLRFLDFAFVMVILSIISLFVFCRKMEFYSIHLYILAFLALGLIGSFKWFIWNVKHSEFADKIITDLHPTEEKDE
eukprot:gnl/Trimastix_PCT/4642.p1 GENE.gnl/Trimastix_PCT/4642~~gnl/Trimastix_PCT/4642.p1  ORF type:complete len:109 (+),score=13.22 gnl/Trimastix_PCT/4642:47-373(+)